MANLDLDELRAARVAQREAEGIEPITFTLEGDVYALPAEYPMKVLALFGAGEIDAAFRLLLSPADLERFEAVETMSVMDMRELLIGIQRMYGLNDLGEAVASPNSSENTSRRSRRTSNASTG